MQKLFDIMVAVPLMLLCTAEWDCPPMQSLLIGMGLLAVMSIGAYLGGYIVGTAPHRRRKKEDKRKTSIPTPW